eukprot:1365808-Pleurochrysis_carterae.AAC.3
MQALRIFSQWKLTATSAVVPAELDDVRTAECLEREGRQAKRVGSAPTLRLILALRYDVKKSTSPSSLTDEVVYFPLPLTKSCTPVS